MLDTQLDYEAWWPKYEQHTCSWSGSGKWRRISCNALVSILHAITSLLTANSYVIVVALDFSKAFDTVRHSSVLQNLAQLDIPDHIFNWISDYLQDHSHCTVYNNYSSDLRTVSASIIQGHRGSGVGPSLYVVEAADLNTVIPGNLHCKYADDTLSFLPATLTHD